MNYKSLAPELGLCIDWETSGSDFARGHSADIFQGISFGAAIFNTRTFDIIDTLYREVKFDSSKYQWSMDAQRIHGLSREYLEEHGISREDACCDLVEFMLKYLGPSPKVMVLGHNVAYDISYTRQLLGDFGVEFDTHHVQLDTACLSFIHFGTYKSDHLFEIMGFEHRQQHNALEDVFLTIEAAKTFKLITQEALGI